eukprot:CAMPEP_0116920528 /NCGR_PEP_ID=MMETSP0467-20121206/21079_1 /TAXON_ID=283647 /ORGANISM="Mesodinium pulex, Strain SPMC105" /LENGTH=115 /DNA_ID=CAMNT_0004598403 /DNA_START=328 /DNA_END=675 /DNA_ORIENTATION=+
MLPDCSTYKLNYTYPALNSISVNGGSNPNEIDNDISAKWKAQIAILALSTNTHIDPAVLHTYNMQTYLDLEKSFNCSYFCLNSFLNRNPNEFKSIRNAFAKNSSTNNKSNKLTFK